MKNFVLIFFIFLEGNLFSETYNLAICAIFQNEAPYMKEWIDYHLKVGVEHFFLYNNNSADNYMEILKPYIGKNIVELIIWPSDVTENECHHYAFEVQTGAYIDGIVRAKENTKWLALIDLDEFIVPVVSKTINEVLDTFYDDVAGLCVNWQCYGTSHVRRCGQNRGSVYILKELVYKMRRDNDWNKWSKSIVRPSRVVTCPNPHFCTYQSGYWAVDGHHNRTEMCPSEVIIDKMRINHYWTRDEWYLKNMKIPRYKKWGNKSMDVLNRAEEMNFEKDDIILQHLNIS